MHEILYHIKILRPLAKPGMDALGMTAPVLVQMNPEGKWQNCKPKNMDEERLKAVVQHLVNSDAVSAVQSYCCQCAAESQVFIKIPTQLFFRLFSYKLFVNDSCLMLFVYTSCFST